MIFNNSDGWYVDHVAIIDGSITMACWIPLTPKPLRELGVRDDTIKCWEELRDVLLFIIYKPTTLVSYTRLCYSKKLCINFLVTAGC